MKRVILSCVIALAALLPTTTYATDDTTPPTAVITTPVDGAVLEHQTDIWVEFSVADESPGTVSGAFYIDGVYTGVVLGEQGGGGGFPYRVPGQRHTTHTFTAVATDASGNQTTVTNTITVP